MTDRTEHAVLDGLYDALQDALYVFDDDRVLIDANARVGEVSGLPREELVGWQLEEFQTRYVAPADRERLTAAFDRIEGGDSEAERLTFTLETDEESVPVDGRFVRYDNKTVVLVRNLTEQKERERRLSELSEELDVLNRVLRHDIRNDMNVVLGWAEELDPHVAPEGRKPFENIVDAVEHTVGLTREVRDLAEAITRGETFPTRPTPLADVLSEQLAKNRKKFETATFELTGELPPVEVVGNEMLSSVFDNLFSNAVIHHDGDHPTVTVDVTVEEEAAVVRVADDGPGIPDSQKTVVFGRGEQGIDSPGAGIGLFLVDSLVTGFGGTVAIEDNEPRGAVFVVTLPLATAE
ncbi:PAS domain-containing sensor histidine kinase [Haloarchaeobius iranensis]|uniref:PAS domain S-box-containing protein n=1 Tax=Haloarchaeobius iranensis TaxID=996166 RepID=A0A1G9WL18_9EURY|nr:PAS domain-containing sensor histidine kinase [Haloarchaeobius iranensis]SDM84735.1 PAS domain S-box-containing protein [Haloarchaeobius iranensis]